MPRNAASDRLPATWIARATSSLPVPLSPVIRMLIRVSLTRSIRSNTACMASEVPMMFWYWSRSLSSSRSARFSLVNRCWISALSTMRRSSSILNGLIT